MADQIDDLLRAADRGVPVGTTQRYFKKGPGTEPKPEPKPDPKPAEPAAPANESEKDYIDRIMGRKKQSMSDVDERPVAGERYAMADTAEAAPKGPTPDPKATLAHVRAIYPQYKDVDDATLGNALAARYPQYAFLAKAKEYDTGPKDTVSDPSSPEDVAGRVLNPGQPKPLDMVQKVGNVVGPAALTAPLVAAGGELLPAAPLVGRALTQGALSIPHSISRGAPLGETVWDAVLDAVVSAGTEGLVAGGTRVGVSKFGLPSLKTAGEKIPGAAAGRERAGGAIDSARDLIKDRIPPKATFLIPAIDAKNALSLADAAKALKGLNDPQYSIAKAQLVSALNEAERAMLKQGVRPIGGAPVVKPYAGSIFNKFAPSERFVYQGTKGEQLATKALNASRSPFLRATGSGVATEETDPSGRSHLPAGLLLPIGLSELAGAMPTKIPKP